MTDGETAQITREYIDAVGRRDLSSLAELFDDALVATFFGARLDKAGWIDALSRLFPVLVRNDIRDVYAAGERGCVVYDFVTDTPAGGVLCVELVTVRAGQIVEVELLLDRVSFAPVRATLDERAAAN
jgi:ketosteroid isomerase-like protein